MASAAARCSLDVSAARSVADVVDAIAAAGGRGWLRVWGHDDDWLAGTVTTEVLDRAAPDRPVVAHHRTGHVVVLSSVARHELGGDAAGLPADGVVVERPDLLSALPGVPVVELEAALGALSEQWWQAGITGVTDATHTNGPAALEQLDRWCRSGVLRQEVTAMVAVGALGSVPGFGQRAGRVTVGWAKVMPPVADDGAIASQVERAHRGGFPAAVHVMDVDTLAATLDAFSASPPPEGALDRIEHCALALPEQHDAIAASGAAVVVNPSFLVHRAEKYQSRLSAVEQGWLVPVRSLLAAGVVVRAGSDSPVVPADPGQIIAAASSRTFAPAETVSMADAEALLSPWQLGVAPSGGEG